MNEINNEIKYLWQVISSAQDESIKYKDDFMNMLIKADELNKKIYNAQKIIDENIKEKNKLVQTIEELKNRLEKEKETVNQAIKLSEDFNKIKIENTQLLKEIEDRKNKEELTNIELNNLKNELLTQKELLDKKEKTISELNFKIKAMMDSETIKMLISNNEENKLDLIALLKNYEENIIKLESEIKNLKTYEKELSENKEKISLEKESLEKQYKKALTKIDELTNELQKSKEEKEKLKEQIKELLETKEKLNKDFINLKENNEILKIEYEKKLREITNFEEEIAELKNKLKNSYLKIEEEKNNFADAVKKIFSLQSILYETKEKLKKLLEENTELVENIEKKKKAMEQLNLILQTRSIELKGEKELNSKLEIKLAELNKQANLEKENSIRRHTQMLELINNLKEKDEIISSLKNQLSKISELENEINNLKREKIKLTGIIKKDQFDFNEKIIEHLNKISKEIKITELKIPTIAKSLTPIEKNFLNIINLMKSWQDYIDDTPLEKEIVNAREFFENFFNPWHKVFLRKKITFIKNNIVPDTIKIKINQEKIKNALYQLIKNEYEYLPVGATLKILIKKDEQVKNIIISMEDTSEGLTPEVVNKLFMPFNTTKKDHAGIGFAISNKIIAIHDGNLKISNKEKQGIIIEILLPIAE